MSNEQIDRLSDVISPAARKYAQLHMVASTKEVRDQQRDIALHAIGWTCFEVAYFCQQVTSYFGEAHRASLALTIFTNQMSEGI